MLQEKPVELERGEDVVFLLQETRLFDLPFLPVSAGSLQGCVLLVFVFKIHFWGPEVKN